MTVCGFIECATKAERDGYRKALEAILNTRKHTAALDIAMNALGKPSTDSCSLPVEHRTATGGPYQPARESSTEAVRS